VLGLELSMDLKVIFFCSNSAIATFQDEENPFMTKLLQLGDKFYKRFETKKWEATQMPERMDTE